MNKNLTIAITIYSITFTAILLYFISLLTIYKYDSLVDKDILSKRIYGISFWEISHLLLYIILGYLIPEWFIQLIIVGILWEIIEVLLGKLSKPPKNKITGEFVKNWWTGTIKDIIFNTIGLSIGFLLNKKFKKSQLKVN